MKEKKIISSFLIGIFLISMFSSFVSAEQEVLPEDNFNFLGWLKSIFNIGEFSIVGDYRQCERTPSKLIEFEPGETMTGLNAKYYCESGHGLIDVYTNWNPYGEYSDEAKNLQCGSSPCQVEIYCCPYGECTSDSECENTIGEGSECVTKTAEDENIDYQTADTFNYCTQPGGEQIKCWYFFEGDNSCSSRIYLGDTSCPDTYMQRELYESETSCESQIEGEEHSTEWWKCIGDMQWQRQGEVSSDNNKWCPDENSRGYLDEDNTYHCLGERLQIPESWCPEVNEHSTEWWECIGEGVYQYRGEVSPGNDRWCSNEEDIGYLAEDNTFHCLEERSQLPEAWCPGETSFEETCDLNEGTICQADEQCVGTSYFPDSSTGRHCCDSQGCEDKTSPTPENGAEAITWTEFYSMNNEHYSEKISFCENDNQCPDKEGYEVVCKSDERISERSYEITKEACDENLGWLDELTGLIGRIVPFGLDDPCGVWAESWESWKEKFTGNKYCIAESETWYGQTWESTLKTVGSMGVPYQYVVLATGALILILLALLMRIFI